MPARGVPFQKQGRRARSTQTGAGAGFEDPPGRVGRASPYFVGRAPGGASDTPAPRSDGEPEVTPILEEEAAETGFLQGEVGAAGSPREAGG